MQRSPNGLSIRARLLVSLVIAGGLVLIVLGLLSSVSGTKALGLPKAIESVDPLRGAVGVPTQAEIFVDLASGFTGEITLDGALIPTVDLSTLTPRNPTPGQQVDLPPAAIYERGNATLTFRPVKGAPVEALTPGNHTASVRYWSIIDGPSTARTYTWTFSVF